MKALEAAAWRYRARRPIGDLYRSWSFTEDAEKIARLGREVDDDGGRLTNERVPTWVIEPLVSLDSLLGDIPEEAHEAVARALWFANGGGGSVFPWPPSTKLAREVYDARSVAASTAFLESLRTNLGGTDGS